MSHIINAPRLLPQHRQYSLQSAPRHIASCRLPCAAVAVSSPAFINEAAAMGLLGVLQAWHMGPWRTAGQSGRSYLSPNERDDAVATHLEVRDSGSLTKFVAIRRARTIVIAGAG